MRGVFPYHKQETKYTCGPASMRMVLEKLGIKKSEEQLAKLLKTNKIRGTYIKYFPKLAKKFKLNYIVKKDSSLKDLKDYHKKGYLIIINYFYPPEKVDHYSVLRDINSRYIYFWDPWFGPEHKYKIAYFKKIWKCNPKFDKEKAWFIAISKHIQN